MWEPVGPLPATVYWRRRCVALASAVTLVGLVAATAGAPVPTATGATTAPGRAALPGPVAGSSVPTPDATSTDATSTGNRTRARPDGPASRGTASGAPAEPAPGTTARATGTPAPAAPTSADTAVSERTVPPDRTAPSAPSAAPSAASTTGATAERIRPDDTPRPSVPAQPAVPVPPSGPVPCTNAMLSAAAELDRPVHRVGSRPVLRLVVASVSGQPCVRDLDSARQEVVVWSQDGTDRLWSSNDCVNASTIDLRTLVPGRPVAFAVTLGRAHHGTGLPAAPHRGPGRLLPAHGPGRRPDQPADAVHPHAVTATGTGRVNRLRP